MNGEPQIDYGRTIELIDMEIAIVAEGYQLRHERMVEPVPALDKIWT